MASTLKPIIPLPQPRELLIDPKTGEINKNWYLYFKSLDAHTREIESRLDAIGA